MTLGYAAARATCSPCYFPVRLPLLDQMRSDLNTFSTGLQAFGVCLPNVAGIVGQVATVQARLGAVTGIESYNDLVALYQMPQTSLRSSPCVCGQAAPPPTPAPQDCATCAQQRCPACAGTMIMLCQAYGNPACQECIDRLCR